MEQWGDRDPQPEDAVTRAKPAEQIDILTQHFGKERPSSSARRSHSPPQTGDLPSVFGKTTDRRVRDADMADMEEVYTDEY